METIFDKDETIIDTLKSIGSRVNDNYYFLPFWFEYDKDGDLLFIHHLDDLPTDLKRELDSCRAEVTNTCNSKNQENNNYDKNDIDNYF